MNESLPVPMNILFICDEYPPGKSGGIGTVVQLLGRALCRAGHNVFVAGLYPYAYKQKDYEDDQGVKVWRIRYGFKLFGSDLSFKFYKKLPAFVRKNLNGRRAFRHFIGFINNIVASEGIDIIEIADWNNFAMQIGFTVEWPSFNAPLVLKSHGSYTKICDDLLKKAETRFLKMDQALFRRADAISAVSYHTAECNKKLFNLSHNAILYNAINLPYELNSGVRSDNTVIYAGALIVSKGIEQLMKAWNIVTERNSSLQLHVYGNGKKELFARHLTEKSKPTVFFHGYVTREVLMTVFANATMAVLPSYSETFGLVAVEAMSMGCPVIYTNRASGPEIIEHLENGILVDPDNVDEIANNIIKLINDPLLREQLGMKGRKKVITDFEINKSVDDHIRFYENVIMEFKNRTR